MKQRRHNGGFSLLEVMCALLILGVALVGLAQGISTALTSTKESELQTAAALLAAGRIETLRADGRIIDGERTGDGGEEMPRYRWRETVSGAPISGLHEVRVTVEYAPTGREIYALQTLLFDPPPAPAEDGLGSGKQKDRRKEPRRNRR